MAKLGLDRDFLKDFWKLEKPVQKATLEAIDKFAEHTHAGLHLEKIQKAKDDRIRTIRIDRFWRGVVFAPESGQDYTLIRVLPHNDAIEYAASRKFSVNQALGVADLRDQAAIEQIQPTLEQAAGSTSERVFAHVSDADLARLGIDDDTMEIIRLLPSLAHLEKMERMLPEAQYNALLGLALGQTPEEVWAEISQYAPAGPIDTGNIVQALERTQGRVVFVDSNEELAKILEHPFALWRTFLHPAQEKIARAPRYAGPAQVTGGAGTGKTVTALHRTAFLARRVSEELGAEQEQRSVLLTTFNRNLAGTLESQLKLLVDEDEIRGRVDILNVDRLGVQVGQRALGFRPAIVFGRDLEDLWATKSAESGLTLSPSALLREWEQVILGQDIRTEQEYLTCSRAGQGTPLGKAQRRQVWQLVQDVEKSLADERKSTFLQLANEAARYLKKSGETLYRHVIIDEAQDLHPAQWRLLRAAVAEGPNDMFITGDTHQRIYANSVSLAKVGINIRGRSRKLTVNYRTTQEILAMAVPALGKAAVTGLDDEADTLDGYRSPLHGGQPEIHPASSRNEELTALTAKVKGWIDDGIEPHAIGVAARTTYAGQDADTALSAAGIPVAALDAKPTQDGVRVGTMHKMKGLEFQAVAVIDVSDGVVPAPGALTPAAEDKIAHAQDLQRERCLLFVACTRARDHLYLSYSGAPSPFLS